MHNCSFNTTIMHNCSSNATKSYAECFDPAWTNFPWNIGPGDHFFTVNPISPIEDVCIVSKNR